MTATRLVSWSFLVVTTYVLGTIVVGRGLATWHAPGLVLAVATAFVSVVWSSVLAAALASLRDTAIGPLFAPVLGTRGLTVLGLVSIGLFAVAVYVLRS